MTIKPPANVKEASKKPRGKTGGPVDLGQTNNHPSSKPAQTRGKASSVSVNQGPGAPVTNPVKSKDEVVDIPILILGPQGCGKSSLINVAFGKPFLEISNGFDLATKRFNPLILVQGKHHFVLVDSPGFDNTSMSNEELLTKLVRFLCCGKAGATAKMAGVIYVHPQETRLGSGILRKNLHFIKSLLGDSFMDRLTILLVPRPGEKVDHKKLVQPLLDPKSPFYALHKAGARVDVAALETQPIRDLLLSYAGKAPECMAVQNALCEPRRTTTDEDITTYLTKCARAIDNKPVATRPKITPTGLTQIRASSTAQNGSSEITRLQLQLAESKKQTEGFSTQLQQHLDQYNALRSQLQINENLEQKDIVQYLIDLNRRIEDLALSLSQHLVDTYGGGNMITTQNAFQLPELKQLFDHEEGKASLVLSSTGVGMPLEDFLDVAIRSILCEQIYKRIVGPFHPGLVLSDARNRHISAIYSQIREKESQATLGRWRTASFTAISRLIGEQELSHMKSKVGLDILNENLMPMLQFLFGPDKNAQPRDSHVEGVIEARNASVGLPVAHRYGVAFDHKTMSEFEPRSGGPPPGRILSTIGLGLNVFRGQSSGEGSDRVVLCKASVVTEGWFERP
ncbi:hypothetical protein OPQ81_011675 [Rhizoctonia solani]|nr:hypothetical protein OPQ81_011675 [Rhizoctonia solani]